MIIISNIWIVQLLVVLSGISLLNAQNDPIINVKVQTRDSWTSPPPILEYIEFIRDEPHQTLYTVVDFLLDKQLFQPTFSAKDLYKKLVQDKDDRNTTLVSHLLDSTTSLPFLKMALASRTSTPRIEALFHYYREYVLPSKSAKESFDKSCRVWLLWNNVQQCSVDNLSTLQATHVYDVFHFEEIYPTKSSEGAPLVILYASVIDSSFPMFYQYVKSRADKGELRFVLRYIPNSDGTLENSSQKHQIGLSGYGVELAIKNTEYKVQDDRVLDASSGISEKTDVDSDLDEDDTLFSQEPIIAAISDEDKTDLGLRIVSHILNSSRPLNTLTTATQDLPRYCHLFKGDVSQDVEKAARFFEDAKRDIIPNSLSINGFRIDSRDLDAFKINKLIRSEHQVIQNMVQLGLSAEDALEILSAGSSSGASSETVSWGETFDVRSEHVFWLNNIEKDKRYGKFPRSLFYLLQPSYGRLKYVRRNIFNVVFFIDPLDETHLKVVEAAAQLIKGLAPIRFGIVFLPETSKPDHHASLAAKIGYTAARTAKRATVMRFLEQMREAIQDGHITEKKLDQICRNILSKNLKTLANEDLDKVDSLESVSSFAARFGISRSSGGGLFANGKHYDLKLGWEQTVLQETYFPMIDHLVQKLYGGEFDESADIYKHFMELPTTLKLRNPYIFTSDKQPAQLVDFTRSLRDKSLLKKLPWLYSSTSDSADVDIHTSVILFGDFLNNQWIPHVKAWANVLASLSNGRLAILSTTKSKDKISNIEQVFSGLAQASTPLEEMTDKFNFDTDIDSTALTEKDRLSLLSAYGIALEATAVSINGRVIVFKSISELLSEEEISYLVEYESKQRISSISEVFHKKVENGVLKFNSKEDYAHSFLLLSSTANMHRTSSLFFTFGGDALKRVSPRSMDALKTLKISFSHGDSANALIRMTVILDPLTKSGQKLASFIKAFKDVPGIHHQIFLIPSKLDKGDKVPVDRFYRFVWTSEPMFDSSGNYASPQATFKGIPTDPLLTLGLDLPNSWLVRPKQSVYDLDNLKLRKINTDVNAIFELQNILVEGHAANSDDGMPPRGLQFVLGSTSNPELVDTITMANLGYLQLKANPGVWQFKIREGRSSEVYQINTVYDSERKTKSSELLLHDSKALVILNSFEGVTIYPEVQKRPGMEQESVLIEQEKESPDSEDSIWNSIKKSLLGTKSSNKTGADRDLNENTINVFSVASGHLYERFLSIMTLSVTRQTKSRVRFWLIENFLSPSFLDFLPYLAKQVGFEYELITYKWPRWLNAQTEKQRIIWAYKILFLDVMFPLKLDKVIFVDADQVVRTDLKELVDMDLKGAVYGYTPFCNDRPEVDEFRFWKSGYWESHLQGRPYHISALYVVDLVRFRAIAAGDRLRGQYHMLSQDPNSLANLDQDLPNNMIHEIPMFSLPQEWLWCETWCSDASLAKAKTIDLCNNPLTKEPKLDRARRILPEWEGLDKEIQAIRDKYESEKAGKSVGSSTTTETSSTTSESSTPTIIVDEEKDDLDQEKHQDL